MTGQVDAPAALEARAERWFERSGVPHFSVGYQRKDLLPTAISTLAVVLAFEVTALPWLDLTLAGVIAALVAVVAVLLLVVPLLRNVWEPHKLDLSGLALGVTLRIVGLAIVGILLSFTPLPGLGWEQWLDFAFFVILLFAAIILVRGRRLKTFGRPSLLGAMTFLSLILVEGFAFEGSRSPAIDETFGIAAPGSAFALPAAAVLLALSIRAVAPGHETHDASRWRAISFAVPVLLVTLGVQITMLPRASASSGINQTVPFAVVILVWLLPRLFATDFARRFGRWLNTRPRAVEFFSSFALGGIFIWSLPLYVDNSVAEGVTTRISAGDAWILNTVLLLVIWFVVGSGLDRMAKWMAGETLKDAPATFGAFVGSLPIVVILLFFVAITTETWVVATRPPELHFAAILGVLVLLTGAIALWGCLRELGDNCKLATWEDVRETLANRGPRDREIAPEVTSMLTQVDGKTGSLPEPDLRGRARLNLVSVMMVYQVIYCGAIALFTTALFYLVAKLAVSREILDAWEVKVPDDRLRAWDLDPIKAATAFGEWPPVNQPWTRLALLLGAFSALVFVAHVTGGADNRATFFCGPDLEVRRRLAMRYAYHEFLERASSARRRGRARRAAHIRVARRSRARVVGSAALRRRRGRARQPRR